MIHKAGRALDALVAEKVMGYLWWHKDGRNKLMEPNSIDTDWVKELGLIPGKSTSLYDPQHRAPHYSTDIAAAWKIMELPQHVYWLLQRYGEQWVIYTGFRAMEDGTPLAQSDTAPLAICLAALRAVGVAA